MLYLFKAKGLISIKEYPCAFCGGVIPRHKNFHLIHYIDDGQKNCRMHVDCSEKFCRENFLTEYKKGGMLHHEDCERYRMGYPCDCPE